MHHYRLRNGVRVGGGSRAELVNVAADEPAALDMARRRAQRINALYRAWSRRPADVEGLRELHQALEDYLRDRRHRLIWGLRAMGTRPDLLSRRPGCR